MLVLQTLILVGLKGIGEWKGLKMQNLPQIDLQALEIGELADKKPGEALALQQVVNHRVEEEMGCLISLNHHLQGESLMIQLAPLLDLIGLLKLITALKMQLFLVLKKA